MPVIATQRKNNKSKLKAQAIDSSIYDEINEYCEWVGINDVSFFIEEAAKHVFNTDSDWKKYKKSSNKNNLNTEQS